MYELLEKFRQLQAEPPAKKESPLGQERIREVKKQIGKSIIFLQGLRFFCGRIITRAGPETKKIYAGQIESLKIEFDDKNNGWLEFRIQNSVPGVSYHTVRVSLVDVEDIQPMHDPDGRPLFFSLNGRNHNGNG